ncbi:class I SAM-dependent methyltransferase [Ectobacillus sp. sgz5001026]|uniref:class I SAM-dependent methyltransferase n=1 Tax=Ectobacillus sp. sgz5001026 TaxID=3242473 RepID=UPI0036D34E7F
MNSFSWSKSVQKKWDKQAVEWNEKSKEMWNAGSRSGILPFFQTYVSEGATILDAGCGDGYGSFYFSNNGYRVYGVDISTQMIEYADTRTHHAKLSFIQADIAALPYETETFDAIIAVNSLEWVERPLVVLRELKRVLKPEGYICVAILGPTAAPRVNSYRRLYEESVVCNTMMPWEFEMLAKENGFSIVDGKGVYKRDVDEELIEDLPHTLKQALSFMWITMLQYNKEH